MSFLWLGGQHRRWYLRVLIMNNKATKSGPPYNYSLRLVAEWAEYEHPRWHCCKKKDATTGGSGLRSRHLSLPSSFRVPIYLRQYQKPVPFSWKYLCVGPLDRLYITTLPRYNIREFLWGDVILDELKLCEFWNHLALDRLGFRPSGLQEHPPLWQP